MYFQKILKGIVADNDPAALHYLREGGIHCRWWTRVGSITAEEIRTKLNERNLYWHLNRYDDPDPTQGNEPFCDHTPFISTTAGAVERDVIAQANWVYPPFMTALTFATNNFSAVGYVYYGYVITLGKKAIELQHFAEEVRELHIYTGFLPFHDEGEITAKIYIPSVCLERYEKFDPTQAFNDLSNGMFPTPVDVQWNPNYAAPEQFSNVRGVVP
jgi:hypothetical protein